MSKEEFLKIQTCVLKVNIHCDGCKQKVKKILQKIDGVFKTSIDAELGKVTVAGNVDPAVLIKKLAKSGKRAELWGAPKVNNNQNHLPNQFKDMQMDNGKVVNNKGQKGNNINMNNQPKGGQPNQQQLQQLQLQQQLQQLQQMKAFQDLKLPQSKDMKMPPNQQHQKNVRFALPEDDDSCDEYDEFDDDDDFDDEFDDEMDDPHHPLNKMKPVMGNGPQGSNNMMNNIHAQLVNAQRVAPNAGGNGRKGGGGAVPVQMNMVGVEGKNGNGGKKGGGGGGNGNGGNQNQVGKSGGGKPQDGKNGNNGGGGGGGGGGNVRNGSNGGNGNNMQINGPNKGNNGAVGALNDGFPNMGGPHGNMGQMSNIPMGHMGSVPMGQMNNIPAVQGLPAGAGAGAAAAAAAMSGAGGANGYFHGAGPDPMPGNPYHQQQQQQYLTAVMNQQRAMGNERFQPMMYARPPPAINYMPAPYPYPPYPYPPHPNGGDQYANFFSDENTSSCNVM